MVPKLLMLDLIMSHSRFTRLIVLLAMLIAAQFLTVNVHAGNWICPEAEALKAGHDAAYNAWFSGESVSSEEVVKAQNLWFASKKKCDSEHYSELKKNRDDEKSDRLRNIEKLLATSSPVEALRLIRNSANKDQAERERMRKRIGNKNMADLDSQRLKGSNGVLSADLTEGAINLIYSVTNSNLSKLHSSLMSFDGGLRQSPIYQSQYIKASQTISSANALTKVEWEEKQRAAWEQKKQDHLAAKEREREEQERERLLQAQVDEYYRQKYLARLYRERQSSSSGNGSQGRTSSLDDFNRLADEVHDNQMRRLDSLYESMRNSREAVLGSGSATCTPGVGVCSELKVTD